MIYISTSPLSLLNYHLRQIYDRYKFYKVSTESELHEKLTLDSPFNKQVILLDASLLTQVSSLTGGKYCTFYIYVNDVKKYKGLFNKEIKWFRVDPLLYKGELDQFRNIFERDAYDYIWERFKTNPNKLNIEIKRLILRVAFTKKKVTYQDLVCLYELKGASYFHKLQRTFGSLECNEYILKSTTQELHVNFIGTPNRLAFVLQNAIKEKNIFLITQLGKLQEAFNHGKIDLRLGLINLNSRLINKIC